MSDQNIPPQPPPQGGPYGYPNSAPYGAPPYGAPQYGTPQYGAPPYPPGPGSPPGPYQAGPHPSLLASQGVRLGARILDGLLLMAAMLVMTGIAAGAQAIVGEDSPVGITFAVVFVVVGLVLVLGYEPFMLWKYGATVGKQVCRIRVAQLANGQSLSFGQAMGRSYVTVPMGLVPFLGFLNVLWCCWDEPHRQCLHDKVVQSVVVKSQA